MLALVVLSAASLPIVPLGEWTCDKFPLTGARSDDGSRWALVDGADIVVVEFRKGRLQEVERVGHENSLCVAFLHGSTDLAVGDFAGVTLYRHVKDQLVTTRLTREKGHILYPLVLLPSKDAVHVLSWGGLVSRIDTTTDKLETLFNLEETIGSGCLSADGKRLAIGLRNGEVVVATAAGKEVTRFRAHEKRVTAVQFIGDATLVTGSADGKVRTWSLAEVKQSKSEVDTKGYVLKAHAAGDLLVVGLLDGTVCVYSAGTGRLRASVKLHDSDAHTLLAAENGREVLSIGKDRRVAFLLFRGPK